MLGTLSCAASNEAPVMVEHTYEDPIQGNPVLVIPVIVGFIFKWNNPIHHFYYQMHRPEYPRCICSTGPACSYSGWQLCAWAALPRAMVFPSGSLQLWTSQYFFHEEQLQNVVWYVLWASSSLPFMPLCCFYKTMMQYFPSTYHSVSPPKKGWNYYWIFRC